MTQSTPSNKLAPSSFRQSSSRASTSTFKDILIKALFIACTFDVPTSLSVAVACLFSDDMVTRSKSTRRMCEIPLKQKKTSVY